MGRKIILIKSIVQISLIFSLMMLNTVNTVAQTPPVNLIVNGGFEEPDIPSGFQVFPSILGWEVLPGSPDFEIQSNGSFGAPFAGNQHAELDAFAPTGIFQNVPTELGRMYELSFAFSARPNTPLTDNMLQISFGGAVIANLTADGTGQSNTVWTIHTFQVTGGVGNTTQLVFEDLGTANTLGTYIDEIHLVEIAPLPTVTITATDSNASEAGPDTGTFTITRTGDTTSALTANFAVAGTATAGTDYPLLGTNVSIPAGSASTTLTVAPTADADVEGNETVIVTLAPDAAYTVGTPDNATVTIADSVVLPTVTITGTDPNASEAGPDTGTFTITRTGATTNVLIVNFIVAGTATANTDYTVLGSSVSIPAGAASTTLTVMPVADTEVEGAETVLVTLAANAAYTVGTPDNATVTIADMNDIPTLSQWVMIFLTFLLLASGAVALRWK